MTLTKKVSLSSQVLPSYCDTDWHMMIANHEQQGSFLYRLSVLVISRLLVLEEDHQELIVPG